MVVVVIVVELESMLLVSWFLGFMLAVTCTLVVKNCVMITVWPGTTGPGTIFETCVPEDGFGKGEDGAGELQRGEEVVVIAGRLMLVEVSGLLVGVELIVVDETCESDEIAGRRLELGKVVLKLHGEEDVLVPEDKAAVVVLSG